MPKTGPTRYPTEKIEKGVHQTNNNKSREEEARREDPHN